jgi:hypothetical protein
LLLPLITMVESKHSRNSSKILKKNTYHALGIVLKSKKKKNTMLSE